MIEITSKTRILIEELEQEIKTESGNLFIYEDALEEEPPPPPTKG